MILSRKKRRFTLSTRHGFFSNTFVILVTALILLAAAGFGLLMLRNSSDRVPPVSSLYSSWNEKDYQRVYEASRSILEQRPLDGQALALNGFSAYYLHLAQTDPARSGELLDASIMNMRNAWYRVSESERPQIAYVLGKAYYQRGYYYADLSEKYLDYAWNSGLRYPDIEEYRGLAASHLGDYPKAVSAFTDALTTNPSDMLLYTLASVFKKTGDSERAKQYYLETVRTTEDETLELRARGELGMLLLAEKDLEGASAEFNGILEKDANFADAHYGLGVIYETQGDLVRARSEWRKTIRLDPVHEGAREKLKL